MNVVRFIAMFAAFALLLGCTVNAPSENNTQSQHNNSTGGAPLDVANNTTESNDTAQGGNGSGGTPNITQNQSQEEFDTSAPKVVDFQVLDSMISIADIGSEFTATVKYDEKMDAASAPAFTANPLAASVIFGNGSWLDDYTYRIARNVPNWSVELSGIELRISGAKDVAGNTQEDYTVRGIPSVDTIAPSVTGVELSDDFINRQDIGKPFSITVKYNESMGPDAPLITFSQEVIVLANYSDAWLDPQTYQRNYTVQDNETLVAKLKLTVEGAKDMAGNPQAEYMTGYVLGVDTYESSGGGGPEPR